MAKSTDLRVAVFDRGTSNPYSRGLARGLEQNGARVVLAGPNRFTRSPGDPEVVAVYPRAGVRGQRVAKGVDVLAGSARLGRLVASFHPHVAHFQWGVGHDYAIARILQTMTRAVVAFTVHNPVPRGAGCAFQQRLAHLADVVIVHGPLLQAQVMQQYGLDPDRVYVVRHGNFEHAVVRYSREEARARLGLLAGDPVFAYVGQLVPRKGLTTLIDAFRLHCERGRAGTLVVVGPTYGVDESLLRARLTGYGGRVRWMTRADDVPAADIDLAISAANQVVLPFHEATQSGSVLYAMTHGRCVVTTATGELPVTVGEHGVVVPARDPVALADALALAVVDPAGCDALGASARAHVLREFDWTDLAGQTLSAYRYALDTRKVRSRSPATREDGT